MVMPSLMTLPPSIITEPRTMSEFSQGVYRRVYAPGHQGTNLSCCGQTRVGAREYPECMLKYLGEHTVGLWIRRLRTPELFCILLMPRPDRLLTPPLPRHCSPGRNRFSHVVRTAGAHIRRNNQARDIHAAGGQRLRLKLGRRALQSSIRHQVPPR